MKALINNIVLQPAIAELAHRLNHRATFKFYGHVFEVHSTSPVCTEYLARVYGFFQDEQRWGKSVIPRRLLIVDPDSYAHSLLSHYHLQNRNADGYLVIPDWLPTTFVVKSSSLASYYASKVLRLGVVDAMLGSHVTIHAASLCNPKGDGVLLVGEAAVGKTTLALSLLDLGFRFGSDDTTCIERETLDCSCFPLPFLSRVPIHPNSIPDICVAGEPRFFLERPSSVVETIQPSRLCFLNRSSDTERNSTAILPMRGSDAVAALLRNVMFPLCIDTGQRDSIIMDSLPVLASLVNRTQSFSIDTSDVTKGAAQVLASIDSTTP